MEERNADLDEYPEALARENHYRVENVRGHHYAVSPIGVPVMAAPLVLAMDRLLPPLVRVLPAATRMLNRGGTVAPDTLRAVLYRHAAELFVASFYVALAAVVVFLLAREVLDVKRSLLAAFVFAFCTSAWSTASRALWPHGPSMLMLALTLYLVLKSRRRPGLVACAGLPLAFAYVLRPANGISVLFLSLYVFVEHRRYFFRYLLWMLPVAVPFVVYNLAVYDAVLPAGHRALRVGLHLHLPAALAGHLISPARGLLVFSPVLLFSLYGAAVKYRRGGFGTLDIALSVIILTHWILVSSFRNWWGGHSYGPRYFSDMLPYFVYFLLPAIEALRTLRGRRALVARAAFALSVTLSFAIHFRGANRGAVYTWNVRPANVDNQPHRLWDWSDPQFLRR